MEVLYVLEEKIKVLAELAKKLHLDNAAIKEENGDLKTENARLSESNAQLSAQLKNIEDSMLRETGHVLELREEQVMTRSVLDELIRSIDLIVEK